MTRAVFPLLLVLGAVLAGPVAAKPLRFTDRLRAAAEPDRQVDEDYGDSEQPQEDEGLGEPEAQPPAPYGEGESADDWGDRESEGARRPPQGVLPRGEEEAPAPPPSGQKPVDPGPAEPARAVAPVAPIE